MPSQRMVEQRTGREAGLMKTITKVIRIVLGLMFTVFGLNGFLHFIPMQPMPQPAIDFFGALAATGYMIRLIFFGQLIGGVLLLTGVAVPLALVVLAPIVVNICFFICFWPPADWQSHLLWSLWKFFSHGAIRTLSPRCSSRAHLPKRFVFSPRLCCGCRKPCPD
jgi:putative oxidoreductase